MMDNRQHLQEEQYDFPYHYLTTVDKNGFSLHKYSFWGYEYLSYIRFVLNFLKDHSFTSLLDVGCGEGKFLQELSQGLPQKDIHGVDYSERVIALAKAFNPTLSFITGNVSSTTISEKKYDVITLIEVLEHIPPKEMDAFVQGLYNHLTPGGTLLLTTPSENFPRNAKHYQHFTIKKIEGIFSKHFSVSKHWYLNHMGFKTEILQRLLSNQFFILNHRFLRNILFSYYERHLLIGKDKNTKRVCVVLTKK